MSQCGRTDQPTGLFYCWAIYMQQLQDMYVSELSSYPGYFRSPIDFQWSSRKYPVHPWQIYFICMMNLKHDLNADFISNVCSSFIWWIRKTINYSLCACDGMNAIRQLDNVSNYVRGNKYLPNTEWSLHLFSRNLPDHHRIRLVRNQSYMSTLRGCGEELQWLDYWTGYRRQRWGPCHLVRGIIYYSLPDHRTLELRHMSREIHLQNLNINSMLGISLMPCISVIKHTTEI